MCHGTASLVRWSHREMEILYEANAPICSWASTFVYPRNLVAHRDVLREFGFTGYRTRRTYKFKYGDFLDEMNIFVRPDQDSNLESPIAIPSGFYLNWLSGRRKLIPRAITLTRAQRLLDAAVHSGGVVHYYTHPENIATAPATLGLLRNVLEKAARMRAAGKVEILTQKDYCVSRQIEGAFAGRQRFS